MDPTSSSLCHNKGCSVNNQYHRFLPLVAEASISGVSFLRMTASLAGPLAPMIAPRLNSCRFSRDILVQIIPCCCEATSQNNLRSTCAWSANGAALTASARSNERNCFIATEVLIRHYSPIRKEIILGVRRLRGSHILLP